MSSLDAALAYASIGWHVFPIARDKSPRTSHGYKDATTDADLITNHWSEFPDDNIAVALRPSGLIAVDVDPRNGGDVTFNTVEQLYGRLPRDAHAITGTGGQHVVMRDIAERRPRGKLDYLGHGKGVDVKCNGYIVVAPSVNSQGNAYTWATLADEIPSIPDAWVELLYHPIADASSTPEGLGIVQWAASTDEQLSIEDTIALRKALVDIGQRKSGNSTTYRAVRLIFHDYGLSIDEGWPYLVDWNEQCGAPHPHYELERRVCNAADVEHDPQFGSRGRARKSTSAETRIVRAGIPDSDLPGALPASIVATTPAEVQEYLPVANISNRGLLDNLPDLAPVPALANEPYLEHLRKAIDDVASYQQLTGRDEDERPYFIPAPELFRKDDPPPKWLVEGLIIEGGTGVVATEPKSAKTWLATEIAVGVATGTKVVGKFPVRAGSVAYYYTEDLGAAIKTRVRALLKGRGLNESAIARTFHAQPRGRDIDVTKLEDCARLIASTRRLGPIKLLVLDPLRNIHPSDEDKSTEMSAVFRNLRMIGTLLDCTILLVHHAKKATQDSRTLRPGQRMRGSGAIHGFVDSGIYLKDLKTPDPGTFTNTVESEVKAARSAGTFELTLKIDDDPKTQSATNATWETGTVGGTDADENSVNTWHEDALDIVDAFYVHKLKGGGTKMPTRDLWKAVKIKKQAGQLALNVAKVKGWLHQDKNWQYNITPAGEAISRERSAKPTPEIPTSDGPKGQFGAFAK